MFFQLFPIPYSLFPIPFFSSHRTTPYSLKETDFLQLRKNRLGQLITDDKS